MVNQFRVEFCKLRHFKLFRWAVVFLILFGILVLCYVQWELYSGWYIAVTGFNMVSDFWIVMSGVTFIFLYSMVTAWFVGNDFDNRTIHNEIALGYSRWSTLFSRILTCWCAAVFLHFVISVSMMLALWSGYGFYIPRFQVRDYVWLGVILLQLLATQSAAILITILSAHAATALVISGGLFLLVDNVLQLYLNKFGSKEGLRIWGTMFFALAQDNSDGTLITAGCMAVAAIVGLTAVTYFIFRKKELK